ncbi:MAG: aspartate/glutamate racemase family protein [Clostridia bacterium]|nr:aspartate/glutamate racemase family protein [Clostridia bacterium]
MIGIFDSGEGGINALREIKKRAPWIDVCFLADRKNAPYGTKSESELVELVSRDIERLLLIGANKILMACCTASTVYPLLDSRLRSAALPIISPTAEAAAAATVNGKVGVIATEATVSSGAFSTALSRYGSVKQTFEVPAQILVQMVESGISDGRAPDVTRAKIRRLLSPIRESGADTLVLGCTHFCRLKQIIAGSLPGVRIISSSLSGALEMLKDTPHHGRGETVYID